MRRIAIAAASLFLLARAAGAEGLTARALLAFQHYNFGTTSTAGFRQTYDLRLDRAFTTTSLVRLFFIGDDFKGTQTSSLRTDDLRSRRLQPGIDIVINTSNVIAQARTEVLDTRSGTGDRSFDRRLERTSGTLVWTPDALPVVQLGGQRNRTTDQASRLALTDENAIGQIQYTWRGFLITGQEQYSRSADRNAGFDRKSSMHGADVLYSASHLNGKVSVAAEANAQLTNLDESSVTNQPTFVPSPVTISRVLYSVDETPLDSRDHPPDGFPALKDGNLNANAGITLGPDGVSFQNIVIDLGHIDRVDEIRVIVRDGAENPLRNGGGPVVWDAYTSEDGLVWTSVAAQTTFSAPLSLYSITFDLRNGRWFKVVNFGVNSDPTFVTEVQVYYHTRIAPGERRHGTQQTYNSTASVTLHPVRRFTFAYSGLYSSARQELGAMPSLSTTDLEHLGTVQYDISRRLSVREQLLKRDVQTFTGTDDGATGLTTFVDYTPTKQLSMTLEVGNQSQTLEGSRFSLDTRVLHTTAHILRSLSVTFDAGTQTQTISSDGSTARRDFVNLTTNAQLTPRLRMLLTGSLQQARSDSVDPAVALLGPERDNRVASDFIWRSGRELALGVRVGWVSGNALTGFTQRYHVEWYPFADGTVSLGGSYDQDIDPTLNRKSTRAIFNPRWIINRYAAFDVNYTAISTKFQASTAQQRSLFATLTLYR